MALLSGWQDSNLRPPAPKAGAITGLRYTPKGIIRFCTFIRIRFPEPKNPGGESEIRTRGTVSRTAV